MTAIEMKMWQPIGIAPVGPQEWPPIGFWKPNLPVIGVCGWVLPGAPVWRTYVVLPQNDGD